MKPEAKKLIEMVEKGIPANEIREELGIKTKASLKGMYYKALVEAGKVKDIVTERAKKQAEPERRALKIGKWGTILLSERLLVDELGFKKGDRFNVAKRRDSIILTKTE